MFITFEHDPEKRKKKPLKYREFRKIYNKKNNNIIVWVNKYIINTKFLQKISVLNINCILILYHISEYGIYIRYLFNV